MGGGRRDSRATGTARGQGTRAARRARGRRRRRPHPDGDGEALEHLVGVGADHVEADDALLRAAEHELECGLHLRERGGSKGHA